MTAVWPNWLMSGDAIAAEAATALETATALKQRATGRHPGESRDASVSAPS